MKCKTSFNKNYVNSTGLKQVFDECFKRPDEHEAALASFPTHRSHLIGKPNAGIPLV